MSTTSILIIGISLSVLFLALICFLVYKESKDPNIEGIFSKWFRH